MPTAATPPLVQTALDARFLRRVHVTNVVLALVFGGFTALYVAPLWGAGFALGGLWSAANLWVLDRLLRAALRPEGRDVTTIAIAGVVKLPVLYGALVAILVWGDFPPVSLLVGLSIPLVVIVLKALGRLFVSRSSASTADVSADPQPRS